MKKYYDQIVSLIKEHRKYPGCEDILEDIVEDVYTHADVVLNSVTNEGVITSYLSKIVSTSMITVPKRLGINVSRSANADTTNLIEASETSGNDTETDETTLAEDIEELDISEPEDNELQEIADIDISEEDLQQDSLEQLTKEYDEVISEEEELHETEEVDEVLSAEKELIEDYDKVIPAEEELHETEEVDEVLSAEEEHTEEYEEELPAEEELLKYEEVDDTNNDDYDKDLSEISEPDETNIIQDKSEPEIDKTLVDKMINGITSDENLVINEDEILEPVDTDLAEEGLIEDISDEIISLPEEESGVMEEISELDLDIDDSPVEPIEYNVTEQEDLLEDYEVISELTENVAEPLVNNETESIENDEKEPVSEVESDTKNIPGLSAYSAFAFTPQKEEFDLSEVLPEIDALASKYPDLKVLEVFKLKYYQNLSVSEIAKQLGMADTDVLKTLNELMYLVKE